MADSKVLGIGELSKAFQALRTGMETRTARVMVAAAGGLVRGKARAIARDKGLRRTGDLIKNIVIKREPQAPPGTAQYHLGVRHGRNLTRKQKSNSKLAVNKAGRIVKRYEDDPYYWRFLELDTKKRQATPYLQPALQEGKEGAVAAMADKLNKEHEKASKA